MSLMSSSLKGTSYLILLQAFSRLLTFVLNQSILRYTTPSIFGFATIQLELLLSTILFLCREGFRISVQRLPVSEKRDVQEIVNLSYIPITIGLFLSTILSSIYIAKAPVESSHIPYFKSTVWLYAVSTMIELLSEPCYNLALHKLQFKVRATCEGSAVICRCLVTFLLCVYTQSQIGALAFAVGQLTYSVVLLISYLQITTRAGAVGIWPARNSSGAWFDRNLLTLSIANTAQGVLKHVLTEGDKLLISFFSSNEEQGTYGLAANYGGLVARIVLQPIEEASRSYFSNLLQAKKSEAVDTQNEKVQRSTAARTLCLIVRLYLSCSTLLLFFGPKLIRDILPRLLSERWSRMTPVLAAYCYYIPLLAINGILEAFVTATASPATLRAQGVFWIPCSLVFGLAGMLFKDYGAQGLVFANCVNLSMRSTWAASYACTYLGDTLEYRLAMPSVVPFVVTVILSRFIGKTNIQDGMLPYLAMTAALAFGAGMAFIFTEYKQLDRNSSETLSQKFRLKKNN